MPKFNSIEDGRMKGEPCWLCRYCSKKFKSKAQAKWHEKRVHKK